MSRGARSVAQTKARFTGPPAFPASLLFSPHGEAKCVRGPSGLGASRAEEKGASRLARAGVLDRTLSTASKRNEIMAVISCASTVGWWEMQAIATPSRGQRFFTNHESRVTKHGFFSPWCATGGSTGNRRPDHCPRRQAAVFLFAIVHHCSPLFSKKMFCASALAPPGHCFPAPVRVAWGGYGAAWAPAVPRTGNRACWVFTSHETRNMVFPCSSGDSRKSNPKPGQQFFTNHESRITAFTLPYPRFPTISRHFPAFPGPPPPGEGSASRSVAAFLRVVARHGAAMARHGRRPHRQQALLGFHQPRDTQHGFFLFLRRLQEEQPQARPTGFSRITRHESRPLCFSSHDFPAFPASIRPPLEPVSARRQPWLPRPSRLLPPRRT